MSLVFNSLEAIRAAHQTPLLGELVHALHQDLKRDRHPWTTSEVWERYDNVFSRRADYCLWRKQERSQYNSSTLALWSAIPKLVDDGLDSPMDEIVWGTMSIFSGDLAGPRLIHFSKDQASSLATAAVSRLYRNLSPVPGVERECTLTKLFLIAAVQKFYFNSYSPPTMEAISDYLKTLKSILIELDAEWQPGKPLNYRVFSGNKYETIAKRSLLPFGRDVVMFKVQSVLYAARGFVRDSLSVLDNDAKALLNEAYLYVLSAWKTLRSIRIRLEKSGNDRGTDMDKLYYGECKALLQSAQAALDIGDTLQSARMGHFLMRLLPDRLINDKAFSVIGRQLCFLVREAGLEIDSRFHKDRSTTKGYRQSRIAQAASPRTLGWEDGDPPMGPAAVCNHDSSESVIPVGIPDKTDSDFHAKKRHQDPSEMRWQMEMQSLQEWQTILRKYPTVTDPQVLLGLAVTDACKFQGKFEYIQTDQEFLSSTLRLCNRYGLISRAATVLLNTHYRPSKSDFMDFAHNVKRAINNVPFSVDFFKLGYWQMTLRKKCMEINDRETMTPMDILLVHELVHGRSLTNILGSGDEGAQLLTRKYSGDLDEDDIRGALDSDRTAMVYGQSTVKASEISSFIQSAGGSAFSPVCASIVSMSNSRASLVVINPSGNISWKLFPKEGLHGYAENIVEFLPISIFEKMSGGGLLPWGEFFSSLCETIHEEVDRVAPGYSWLMLSVDPILARLPWQDLFRIYAPRKDIVVSLTPSLSWSAMLYKRRRTHLIKRRIWLSSDSDLGATRQEIENTLQEACLFANNSLAIILGHGLVGDDGVPAVRVDGSLLSLKDWIQISECDIVILHSCHSGFMAPKNSTGDFSGAAGVLLGLGCRVVCAPVSEVSQSCAQVLQRHLMQAAGLKEIGARYLSAVRENPEVALYNIYGFADEPIRA